MIKVTNVKLSLLSLVFFVLLEQSTDQHMAYQRYMDNLLID